MPWPIFLLPSLLAPADSTVVQDAHDEDVIEIVVDTKPDWLFPGLDHPRVQAFFRSGSSVGASLINGDCEVRQRPLVRAGSISVQGAAGRSERVAARRFARALIDDVRPALEACYADSLARTPTDATRLTFSVELSANTRGPVRVQAGVLGDVYGNACVHGVLEFADVEPPSISASVDIGVWFWLQSYVE